VSINSRMISETVTFRAGVVRFAASARSLSWSEYGSWKVRVTLGSGVWCSIKEI
jgi:hypothetical protein